jgi:hypothetical protein
MDYVNLDKSGLKVSRILTEPTRTLRRCVSSGRSCETDDHSLIALIDAIGADLRVRPFF